MKIAKKLTHFLSCIACAAMARWLRQLSLARKLRLPGRLSLKV